MRGHLQVESNVKVKTLIAAALISGLIGCALGFFGGWQVVRQRRDWWHLKEPLYLLELRDGKDYAVAALPAGALVYSDADSPREKDKVGFTLWVPVSFNEFRADPRYLRRVAGPVGKILVGVPETFVPLSARPSPAVQPLKFPGR